MSLRRKESEEDDESSEEGECGRRGIKTEDLRTV